MFSLSNWLEWVCINEGILPKVVYMIIFYVQTILKMDQEQRLRNPAYDVLIYEIVILSYNCISIDTL